MKNTKSVGLGDTVESRYSVLDLGKQFEFDKQKDQEKSKQRASSSKENVRQHSTYSGGFKMADKSSGKVSKKEQMPVETEQPKNSFQYKHHFPDREEVFAKLGIDIPKEENQNEEYSEEEKPKKSQKGKKDYIDYEDKYGVQKQDFYSAEDGKVKGKLREKLVDQIDDRVDKLYKKRDMLQNKRDNIVIQEKRSHLNLPRQEEEQLTEAQKVALYKNADKDVDSMIQNIWKKKSPDIGQLEGVIDKHRERREELEKMYYQNKLDPKQKRRGEKYERQQYDDDEPVYLEEEVIDTFIQGQLQPDIGIKKSMRTLNNSLTGAAKYQKRDYEVNDNSQDEERYPRGKFDGDQYDFEYLREDHQNQIQKASNNPNESQISNTKNQQTRDNKMTNKDQNDSSLEKKRMTTVEREKQRKLKILREEMAQVDRMMEEGKGGQRKKVMITPSDKAIENVTHIPLEKRIYEQKYEEYVVDKRVKEMSDSYFRSKERPNFERVKSAKSFEKYQKLHQEKLMECGISDRPISTKKNIEEIEREEDEAKIQQYAQQLQNNQRHADDKRMADLFKRIMTDNENKLTQRKKKDEEFILQFLFSQIDSAKTGVVSSAEIVENLKNNKDAVVFFDLEVKTLFADCEKFSTRRKGLFNYQEFSKFVLEQEQLSKDTLKSERERIKQNTFSNIGLDHDTQKLKGKDELFYLEEKEPKNTYGTCVLNEAKIDALRSIFTEVDQYSDLIVSRMELIEAIKSDRKIQKIKHLPAVRIPVVNRIASLEQILQQIEMEYSLANEEQQKPLEYMSWNQFFDYFKNYRQPEFELQEQDGSEEIKQFDLPNDHLLLIQDIFDMVPRIPNSDFVQTAQFVIQAKKDPQFKSIQNEMSREKSQETELKSENIGETLSRVLEEANEYAQWSEIKVFFSKRGRPMNWSNTNEVKKQNEDNIPPKKVEFNTSNKSKDTYEKQDSGSKRKQQKQQDIVSKRFEGEYDSDEDNYKSPDEEEDESKYAQLKKIDNLRNGGEKKKPKTGEEEIHKYYSKKRVLDEKGREQTELKEEIDEFDKHYKDLIKRQKDAELGPFQTLEQKEVLEDPVKYGILKNTAVDYDKYFGKLLKHKASVEKEKAEITVPKPFKFEERDQKKEVGIYQQKKQQYLDEVAKRDEEEMKKRFKANPVPTSVKVPMLQNIIEKNKEKRDKVKEESQKITLANQNPFSFYEKDLQKRDEKKNAIVESVQKEVQQLKQKGFKAKEVPASSKMDMMKQMEQEKEEARKKRIEERKDEQVKSVKEFSRLAGASEQWKEVLKKRETSKTWEEEKCTFAPKVNANVPDSSKKQATITPASQPNESGQGSVASTTSKMKAVSAFAGLLGKKTEDKNTKVQAFNFQPTSNKQADLGRMDDYNQNIKEDKLKKSNVLARLAPSIKKQEKKEEVVVVEDPENENGDPNEEQNDKANEEQNDQANEEQNAQENENQEETKVNTSQKQDKKKSTKSEELLAKKREQQKKQKQEEEDQKKKEAEMRQKKLKDRAGEVRDKFDTRSAKQIQEEMEKEKLKERQQRAKEEKKDYEDKLKEMNDRVGKRQLLTEDKTHGSKSLAKYRNKVPTTNTAQNEQQIENSQEKKKSQNLIKDQDGDNISEIAQKEGADKIEDLGEIQDEENNYGKDDFEQIED